MQWRPEELGSPILEVLNVRKRTPDGRRVLDGVSFQLRRGQRILIVGSSDAGKSTLLRCLAGLSPPDDGVIRFMNEDTSSMRPIGIMPQNVSLLPYLSVADNVAFGMRRRGRPEAEIRSAVHRVLGEFGILKIAHEFPKRLPQECRVAALLARTIVEPAHLLLFDEPFVRTPPSWRQEFLPSLRTALEERQATAIFTSHDLSDAPLLDAAPSLLSDGTIQPVGAKSA